MNIFKDTSIIEQELVTYREVVDGKDKVGVSLSVCAGYNCVEIILSKDELLDALDLITKEEWPYE